MNFDSSGITLDAALELLHQVIRQSEANRLQLQKFQLQIKFLKEQLANALDPIHVKQKLREYEARIAELENENLGLNLSLSEHQMAVEAVVAKFKAQSMQLESERTAWTKETEKLLNQERAKREEVEYENAVLHQQMHKIVSQVRTVVHEDESQEMTDLKVLVNTLIHENEGLREMLSISSAEAQNDEEKHSLADYMKKLKSESKPSTDQEVWEG